MFGTWLFYFYTISSPRCGSVFGRVLLYVIIEPLTEDPRSKPLNLRDIEVSVFLHSIISYIIFVNLSIAYWNNLLVYTDYLCFEFQSCSRFVTVKWRLPPASSILWPMWQVSHVTLRVVHDDTLWTFEQFNSLYPNNMSRNTQRGNDLSPRNW
jgi:hypothetical protein